VLLDGFDDRSEPPPADPNGAEDAGRTLAEPLRQAEGDLARRERAVAEAAETWLCCTRAELTGEYLDRLRELGEAAHSVAGGSNN
jgi:hypothetical protein